MSEWIRCRKRPVVVKFRSVRGEKEVIKTREGELVAVADDDYIIQGIEGEEYPIKKAIFDKTYEVIQNDEDEDHD